MFSWFGIFLPLRCYAYARYLMSRVVCQSVNHDLILYQNDLTYRGNSLASDSSNILVSV